MSIVKIKYLALISICIIISHHNNSTAATALMPQRAILILNGDAQQSSKKPEEMKASGAECYFNNALQGTFACRNICEFLFHTQFKNSSITEAYAECFKNYTKTANTSSSKPAYINAPRRLTQRLFKEYPLLQLSKKFGTGNQGDPVPPLQHILKHLTEDMLEHLHYNNPCAILYTKTTYCTRAQQGKGICQQQPIETIEQEYVLKTYTINTKELDTQLLAKELNNQYNTISKGRKCPKCSYETLEVKKSLISIPPVFIIDTNNPNNSYPFPLALQINTENTTSEDPPKLISYNLVAVMLRTQKKPTTNELLDPLFQPALGGHYYSIIRLNDTWYLTDEVESDWWYEEERIISGGSSFDRDRRIEINIFSLTKNNLLLKNALKSLGRYEQQLANDTTNKIDHKLMTAHQSQTIEIIASKGYVERYVQDNSWNSSEPAALFIDVPSLLFYQEIGRVDIPIKYRKISDAQTLNQLQQELQLLSL